MEMFSKQAKDTGKDSPREKMSIKFEKPSKVSPTLK